MFSTSRYVPGLHACNSRSKNEKSCLQSSEPRSVSSFDIRSLFFDLTSYFSTSIAAMLAHSLTVWNVIVILPFASAVVVNSRATALYIAPAAAS
jgi:hypothetical protein